MRQDRKASGNGSEPSEALAARQALGQPGLSQPIAKMHGETLPPFALEELLSALQAMQAGDFSVRLPGSQTGIDGKIADTFNDIVSANERMAAAARAGGRGGRQAKARPASASSSAQRRGAWGEMEGSVNTLIDDLLWPTTEVTRAISAVAKGDLLQTVESRRRRPPAEGRVPALRHHRQHHDQAAQRVHLGSDARGARSRHRRQAGRPGPGARGDAACGRI